MTQSRKILSRAFVAHHQTADILQPRVGTLDDPPALVTSQLSPVLMRGDSVVRPCRGDRLDGTLDQHNAHGVAVVASIGKQPLGLAALRTAATDASVLQRRLQEFDLRGGSLLHR